MHVWLLDGGLVLMQMVKYQFVSLLLKRLVTRPFVDMASSLGLTASLMKTTGMKIVVEPSFVDGMPCGGQGAFLP